MSYRVGGELPHQLFYLSLRQILNAMSKKRIEMVEIK